MTIYGDTVVEPDEIFFMQIYDAVNATVQGGVHLGLGTTTPRTPHPFTDVGDSPFVNDIIWLYESGITKGCTATRFCPDDTVTRGQMAAFLNRALSLPPATKDYFTDDAGNLHEANINRLAASGITKGCGPTTYCPASLVTRGQMAAFLHRALQ